MTYAGIFRPLKHLKWQAGYRSAAHGGKDGNRRQKPAGPDLAAGISTADLPEGAMLAGHVGDDEVLLVRQNGKLFALAAHCTHYHGPLAEGLLGRRYRAVPMAPCTF